MSTSPQPAPEIDPTLYTAIDQRRLLRLRYKEKSRIVEPHDYGIHHGVPKLFAYQIGGVSSQKLPNWRWFDTALISEIEMLRETFAGGRLTSSGQHHKWDKLFIRVKPAGQ